MRDTWKADAEDFYAAEERRQEWAEVRRAIRPWVIGSRIRSRSTAILGPLVRGDGIMTVTGHSASGAVLWTMPNGDNPPIEGTGPAHLYELTTEDNA